ncbi:hypothetical protein FF38_12078 [Lucilia cuprina]|uniref:ARF7 effector protein C-terminal domain-containing protein n=1 Tax=Lucilia cuprina TaxID=7375 RepID=A0A0L0BPQ4_LUCCU|nr:hypothetical protein FF38_12078 [Lucilia cuprina]
MNTTKKKETKRRGRPLGRGNNNKEFKEDVYEWMVASRKQNEYDACDCLIAMCPGCWYPCETCGSNKCSAFCRTTRPKEPLEWKVSE